MAYKILVLKGDGIGPEVVGEALQVLKTVARQSALELEYKEALVGGASLNTMARRCKTTCSRRRWTATRSCWAR